MPDVTVELPVEGTGVDSMTQVPTDVGELGDIDGDCLQVLLEDMANGHTAFIEDQAATEEMLGQIVDFSSGRKFDEVDPIEAAAAEVILKKKP